MRQRVTKRIYRNLCYKIKVASFHQSRRSRVETREEEAVGPFETFRKKRSRRDEKKAFETERREMAVLLLTGIKSPKIVASREAERLKKAWKFHSKRSNSFLEHEICI